MKNILSVMIIMGIFTFSSFGQSNTEKSNVFTNAEQIKQANEKLRLIKLELNKKRLAIREMIEAKKGK